VAGNPLPFGKESGGQQRANVDFGLHT
jgi:hypothetical protein